MSQDLPRAMYEATRGGLGNAFSLPSCQFPNKWTFLFSPLVVNCCFKMQCKAKNNWKHINETAPKTVFHLASPYGAEDVCHLRDLLPHCTAPGIKLYKFVSKFFIPAWPLPMWPFMNTLESFMQVQLMLRELFWRFSNRCWAIFSHFMNSPGNLVCLSFSSEEIPTGTKFIF